MPNEVERYEFSSINESTMKIKTKCF